MAMRVANVERHSMTSRDELDCAAWFEAVMLDNKITPACLPCALIGRQMIVLGLRDA